MKILLRFVALISMLLVMHSSVFCQVSVVGMHEDTSQVFWSGIGNDLINDGSPTLQGVVGTSLGGAIINGDTSSSVNGELMYLDQSSYSITYTLNTSINTLGYDIISIDSYAGWTKWRVNQIYDITYTTMANSAPIALAQVSYLPVKNGVPAENNMSTRIHVSNPSDVLATGVKSITFTFKGDTTQPASGVATVGAIYRELDVVGRPSQAASLRTLASGGSSDYVIVVPAAPVAAVITAAQQFQYYFKEITGVLLPIVSETAIPLGSNNIFIGLGAQVHALLPGTNWTALKSDGFVVKTVGDSLVLAGNEGRGTLYAVFDFLEKRLNCRWWTAEEKDIPTASTVTIPNLDFEENPVFAFREHYTRDVILDPVFATKMRENGNFQTQSDDWGSHYEIIGSAHTHFQLAPPSEHFATHPEWYTDPNTGLPCTSASPMPTIYNSQLCLSAAGLVNEVADHAETWISAHPSAKYISITENDNGNYCKCPSCSSLRASQGSQSGPNLNFVNQVADLIHNAHPNILVETLAYRGNVQPPATLQAADNVLIRFAPLMSDFGSPLNSVWNGPNPPGGEPGDTIENAHDNLPAWAEITNHLFVWNYITNFKYTMLPYPNFHLLGDDLRFFANHKVTGVFEQGDNFTGGVGDFVQLRTWVIAKLLWNPFVDQDIYADEFLNGYYGNAAPYLKNYLDLVRSSYLATDRKLWADESDFSYMTLETMNEAKTLFDQAEAAVVSDPVKLNRVRRERISFDLMWLYRYTPLRQVASFVSSTPFLGPSNPKDFLDEVDADATDFGVLNYQENYTTGGFSAFEVPKLKAKISGNLSAYLPENIPTSLLPFALPNTEVANLSNFIILKPYDLKILDSAVGAVGPDPVTNSVTALRLNGDSFDWVVQFDMMQYPELFYNGDDWKMYVEVRVKSTGGSGAAFEAGVYDMKQWSVTGSGNVFHRQVPYTEVADEDHYHLIEIGSASKIPATSFLWLSGAGNSSITNVFFSRVIFVRE